MTDKMRESFGKWLVQRRLGRFADFNGNLIDCTAVFWEVWQAAQSVPDAGKACQIPVVGEVVGWITSAGNHFWPSDKVKNPDNFLASGMRPLIVQPTHSISVAELERLRKDAERYRWLRDKACNSLSVSRDDDHACNYVTAKEWIESLSPEEFSGCEHSEAERMKESNTIWKLQIYPDTPIGFYVWYGATLDYVIDAAIAGEKK